MRTQHGRRPVREKFHDRLTDPDDPDESGYKEASGGQRKDEAPCSETHGGYKETYRRERKAATEN